MDSMEKTKKPERRDWNIWPVHMNFTIKPDGKVEAGVLVQGSASIQEANLNGEGETVMAALSDAFKGVSDDSRFGGIPEMVRAAFIRGCQCGAGVMPVDVQDENGTEKRSVLRYEPPA